MLIVWRQITKKLFGGDLCVGSLTGHASSQGKTAFLVALLQCLFDLFVNDQMRLCSRDYSSIE